MAESQEHFDFIIIGNGLAGLQLALKMAGDSFFDNKSIALIDASDKSENDKSWSYWEKEEGQWNHIVHNSWQSARILTSDLNLELNLKPYTYKTIRSIDFYKNAKSILSKKQNFYFVIEKVLSVDEGSISKVCTEHQIFFATHIFDSRIPKELYNKKQNADLISIKQHFKGIFIKTPETCFNPLEFIMMDYRLKDGEQTTFTYVLPFSETEALIEFTYFTSETVDEDTYDIFIKKYIANYLKISDYEITDTEMGVIPMTTFNFEKFSTKNITKIGTAGGWVKASTGYSFKHTEKKVAQIIRNLKKNSLPSNGLSKKKYKFYDKIFLKVLKDENFKGEWVFGQFYAKNSVQTMFRFLDEESSFAEELRIMLSLFSWSFIKAFFKTL